nr:hypothetical protein [uncultured Desulfobulbus sp.]
MNGTRRRRPTKQKQVSLFVALGLLLRRLLLVRVSWYVPAITPVCIFFLAHLFTLVTFVLIRNHLVSVDEPLYASLVTWSVYGLFPLTLSSYVCFFLVARPVAPLLHRRFPLCPAMSLHLLVGSVYGATIGSSLLVLLWTGNGWRALLLFIVGYACGLVNWQLYRRLASVPPLTQQHSVLAADNDRT